MTEGFWMMLDDFKQLRTVWIDLRQNEKNITVKGAIGIFWKI